MSAMSAYGTKLKIGGRSGTAVVNCRQIGGPKLSTTVIEAGAHDSASAFVEKVPGLKNGGQVTLEIAFDPAEATHSSATDGLFDLWTDRTVDLIAVEYPTTPAKGFEADAFVINYEPSAPHDGLLTAKVTFEITGAVSFYTAS